MNKMTNLLTAEEVMKIAKLYHHYMGEVMTVLDDLYEDIFRYVCTKKGVFANYCNYTCLVTEDNDLNDDQEEREGICFGLYDADQDHIFINVEGIVRSVVSTGDIYNVERILLRAINTFAHELTHYIQVAAGEEMDMSSDYFARTHEVEARAIGKSTALACKQYIKDRCRHMAEYTA